MTLYTDRKPREAVARELFAIDLFGGRFTEEDWLNAEEIWRRDYDRRATAVLNTLRELGFITSEGLDAIHAEEDANGEPRSSVVPGAPK